MPTRPLLKNIFLDIPRAIQEYINFRKIKQPTSTQGKQIPVLIIPGFLTGDWSTKPMRQYLSDQGFNVHGWKQDANTKFSIKKMQILYKMIDDLSTRHNQPVVLIGWSLGGLYARELARINPNVSKVITLGSPFGNLYANYIIDAYQLISAQNDKELKLIDALIKRPIGKPSLNIFSRKDGVVHWMSCFRETDINSTRREVFSSHTGMGFDKNVFDIMIKYILEPS